MRKIVITVVGKDSVGIIAGVCTYLADHQVNILDISQTIVDVFYNMNIIVDTAKYDGDFDTFAADLEEIGKELGCIIHAQREDIFDQMHRI